MLHEYAVEPASLNNWQNFRYLIEKFGVSQGRLISQFPAKWQGLVYEACSQFSVREKQILTHELQRLKRKGLIRSRRDYNGNASWMENALVQQRSDKPFHAIIVKSSTFPDTGILEADTVSNQNPLWKVNRQEDFPRTTDALGNATEKFLQISDRIVFVDKMFRPLSDRWKKMLVHLTDLALAGRNLPPVFDYHTGIDNRESQTKQSFFEECNRALAPLLAERVLLKVVRWDRGKNGDFFHARSILSEKGGIDIDWGLDAGKAGETTRVTLMDDEVWERNWENFNIEPQAYESQAYNYIDCVEIRGRKRW